MLSQKSPDCKHMHWWRFVLRTKWVAQAAYAVMSFFPLLLNFHWLLASSCPLPPWEGRQIVPGTGQPQAARTHCREFRLYSWLYSFRNLQNSHRSWSMFFTQPLGEKRTDYMDLLPWKCPSDIIQTSEEFFANTLQPACNLALS